MGSPILSEEDACEMTQAVVDNGADGITFYNYSEAPRRSIEWIKPALRSVGFRMLKRGKNVIAATVQFDGDLPIRGSQRLRRGSGRWYTIPTIGAFWCQLEIQGDRDLFVIPTDETWSTWYSRSRHSDVHRLNDQYFQEIYSFGKEPYGWRSAGFDEGSWTRALVLGDSTGKRKKGGSLPWRNLAPRPFPPFSYDLHLPQHVSSGRSH